ncbi:MAG: DUF5995 family protein [Ginsengibacter sp.]
MIKANSINEVITNLDKVIEWSKIEQSRIGYFAVLYRRMTVAVQQGIVSKAFEDGERMEKLDVIFANRYLQAWDAYIHKQKCSSAWCAVFDACNTDDLVVLQHLILGINTHINLDLAIAAAETCPGGKIYGLQNDFEKINVVISSLMQTVQVSLCKVWFPLKIFLMIMRNRQDAVINFSIGKARTASWANAVALALVQGQAHDNYIGIIDNTVVRICKRIVRPAFMTRLLLKPVLMMESNNVDQIIDTLRE